MRPLFGTLRSIKPIFTAPRIAAVSLYPDVLEVLGDEAAFSVVPIYAAKMEATTGDFVLGMDNTPQYEFEIGLMRSAIQSEDIVRVRTEAETLARQQVDGAAAGALDAVSALSRFVPNRMVGSFFGAPGPDDSTNMRWMRSIFREIFLNLGNDPNMAADADACSKQMSDYLRGLLARRKAELAGGEKLPDDFMCRLIALQAGATAPFDDSVILRLVGGTTVGTVDTISKAIAQALDQILTRPLTLRDAASAVNADDEDALQHIVFEALRFNPQNPFLLRRCMQDTAVAKGTDRETTIHAGSLVLVGTELAMFDPAVFPEPDVFRADRHMENYIHFGHGMHTCFGHLLAQQIIPGTLKPLLQRSGLRRADDGGIRYDGAFPESFPVRFDA